MGHNGRAWQLIYADCDLSIVISKSSARVYPTTDSQSSVAFSSLYAIKPNQNWSTKFQKNALLGAEQSTAHIEHTKKINYVRLSLPKKECAILVETDVAGSKDIGGRFMTLQSFSDIRS